MENRFLSHTHSLSLTHQSFREVFRGVAEGKPEIYSLMEIISADADDAGNWECRVSFSGIEGTLNSLPATVTVSGSDIICS